MTEIEIKLKEIIDDSVRFLVPIEVTVDKIMEIVSNNPICTAERTKKEESPIDV